MSYLSRARFAVLPQKSLCRTASILFRAIRVRLFGELSSVRGLASKQRNEMSSVASKLVNWCQRRDSNRHGGLTPPDFESDSIWCACFQISKGDYVQITEERSLRVLKPRRITGLSFASSFRLKRSIQFTLKAPTTWRWRKPAALRLPRPFFIKKRD
jgi:hypothetical protein